MVNLPTCFIDSDDIRKRRAKLEEADLRMREVLEWPIFPHEHVAPRSVSETSEKRGSVTLIRGLGATLNAASRGLFLRDTPKGFS